MANSEIQLMQLQQSLQAEYTITCDNCGISKSKDLELDESAEYFYEKGWRVTSNGNIHCPTCQNQLTNG